ncbi:MAG TPA: manganese efflux pump MntP family protein [Oscillospiraceae bacterium]|nr:manganese efflux pump MntP family protein [Oscillospiraceae bacterium]
MDYISLVGIAVGLSMDAFTVSLTNGAVTRKVTPWFAAKLALSFGLFQAFMPFIGWLIGKAGAGFINSIDHWVALILLGFLGIQMLVESYKKSKDDNFEVVRDGISNKTLLTLSIATSIDALATGVILPSAVKANTIVLMLISVGIIGLITFVLCMIGVYIGKKFGDLFSSKAEIIGGIVLIAIGAKIFIDHMFLGQG